MEKCPSGLFLHSHGKCAIHNGGARFSYLNIIKLEMENFSDPPPFNSCLIFIIYFTPIIYPISMPKCPLLYTVHVKHVNYRMIRSRHDYCTPPSRIRKTNRSTMTCSHAASSQIRLWWKQSSHRKFSLLLYSLEHPNNLGMRLQNKENFLPMNSEGQRQPWLHGPDTGIH